MSTTAKAGLSWSQELELCLLRGWQGLKHLSHHCCLSGRVSRKWNWKQNSWGLNWHCHMRCGCQFNPLCYSPSPRNVILLCCQMNKVCWSQKLRELQFLYFVLAYSLRNNWCFVLAPLIFMSPHWLLKFIWFFSFPPKIFVVCRVILVLWKVDLFSWLRCYILLITLRSTSTQICLDSVCISIQLPTDDISAVSPPAP